MHFEALPLLPGRMMMVQPSVGGLGGGSRDRDRIVCKGTCVCFRKLGEDNSEDCTLLSPKKTEEVFHREFLDLGSSHSLNCPFSFSFFFFCQFDDSFGL